MDLEGRSSHMMATPDLDSDKVRGSKETSGPSVDNYQEGRIAAHCWSDLSHHRRPFNRTTLRSVVIAPLDQVSGCITASLLGGLRKMSSRPWEAIRVYDLTTTRQNITSSASLTVLWLASDRW